MPVILATQEAEIRRIVVQSHPRQIVHKTLSHLTQKGLAEWLKVEALSSSPSTTKKKKKRGRNIPLIHSPCSFSHDSNKRSHNLLKK
jgi:hypothetical protein